MAEVVEELRTSAGWTVLGTDIDALCAYEARTFAGVDPRPRVRVPMPQRARPSLPMRIRRMMGDM
jgi:hypothetical protein